MDRGAEQSDPLGRLQGGVVIADVSTEAGSRLAATSPGSSAFDVWFADDEQVLCRPAALGPYLRPIDDAGPLRGMVLGRGATC